ncbi:MAG: PilZ domain-containing protein [Thermodesulfovibrionales bacterium]|nr:PilZ domain-containing protein [Thermodesulfovibrionales bacterium]
MISDNRKNKRYVVEGLQGNLLYTSDLEILNISIDGAAIETTRRLELNREYTFKIQYNNTQLILRGQVVWAVLVSKKGRTESYLPRYRAGIQFADTLSENQQILRRFIEENRLRARESGIGGLRCKISNTEAMTINLPRKYQVRKISMSGMLIETDYPLDINTHFDIELFLKDTMVSILVKVITCTQRGSLKTSSYDIGMEFITMSENDQDTLRQLLLAFEE